MDSIDFLVTRSKPSSAYSIFCGIIKTKNDAIAKISGISELQKWQTHIFQDESFNTSYNDDSLKSSHESIKDLSGLYYSSFINCLFPNEQHLNQFSPHINSFTLRINAPIFVNKRSIIVDYLDLFFFPENHLIYCFKCDLTNYTYDEIVQINDNVRQMDIEKIGFLFELLKKISISDCYNIGNKLKLFSLVEHDLDFSDVYSAQNLLFELSTCSPIGTSIGKGSSPSLKPSQLYFDHIMNHNIVSVFENWSALCLFDTFTVLHKGEVYKYNWEFRYFRLLYIHSLFIKSYLGEINKEFYLEKKPRNLEEVFHQFNKHFNLKQISYNFLPQLIYEKIRYGLNIEHELTDIRLLIELDYKKNQEQKQEQEAEREKRTNRALFVVAILAVFTAVWDGAELFDAIFLVERGMIFSALSLLSLCSVYMALIYFLTKRK